MRKVWIFAAILPLVFISQSQGADLRDTDSPYAVLDFLSWDHDWNRHHNGGEKAERTVRLMKEAGVGMVRLDFLWQDVEPQMGKFDFEKMDRLVDLLSKNDIKILGMLQYNVSWASGAAWNKAPSKKFFTLYARAVVARYKDRVKYWEIWNEPDQATYWAPQDDMKSYVELLKAVYPALKEEDPTCTVVLGGLSGGCVLPMRRIYKNGGGLFFDVVNLHPFVNPLSPDPIEQVAAIYRGVYRLMEANCDAEKPIWFTEIGAPGVPKDRTTKDWWLGKNSNEAEQAEWVTTLYTEALKWKGVKKIFWAFFRDTPEHFLTGTDYFGLVRKDFSKKPAFEAYKKLVKGR